jgi:hypothetical protein
MQTALTLVGNWAHRQCVLNKNTSVGTEFELYTTPARYNPRAVIKAMHVARFLRHDEHAHMWLLVQELTGRTRIPLHFTTCKRVLCTVTMLVCAFHDDDYVFSWWSEFLSEPNVPTMMRLHMDVLRRLDWSLMPSVGMLQTDDAFEAWARCRYSMLSDIDTQLLVHF